MQMNVHIKQAGHDVFAVQIDHPSISTLARGSFSNRDDPAFGKVNSLISYYFTG
jgi:hypothetical protein